MATNRRSRVPAGIFAADVRVLRFYPDGTVRHVIIKPAPGRPPFSGGTSTGRTSWTNIPRAKATPESWMQRLALALERSYSG